MKLILSPLVANLPSLKKYLIPLAISTVLAIVVSVVVLIIINASLMKIPMQSSVKNAYAKIGTSSDPSANVRADYSAITERNLFRAKLQVEIPTPKSEKEIEDEKLTNIMKNLTLKGVWFGQEKDNHYAVIDKGQQKGVWTYEIGEAVEGGLVVSDIKSNSVTLKKDGFVATIRLFAKGFERVGVASIAPSSEKSKGADKTRIEQVEKKDARKPQAAELLKEVRNEGKTVIVSKTLVDKIKADNSIVMSTIAVKASIDKTGKSNGFQIVSVDKGSLMEKIGVLPNDIVQEVNGFKLTSSEDIKKASVAFKSSTKFEFKVLRAGQTRSLYYEIR